MVGHVQPYMVAMSNIIVSISDLVIVYSYPTLQSCASSLVTSCYHHRSSSTYVIFLIKGAIVYHVQTPNQSLAVRGAQNYHYYMSRT